MTRPTGGRRKVSWHTKYDRYEREDGGGSFLMGLARGKRCSAPGSGCCSLPRRARSLRNQLSEQTGKLKTTRTTLFAGNGEGEPDGGSRPRGLRSRPQRRWAQRLGPGIGPQHRLELDERLRPRQWWLQRRVRQHRNLVRLREPRLDFHTHRRDCRYCQHLQSAAAAAPEMLAVLTRLAVLAMCPFL